MFARKRQETSPDRTSSTNAFLELPREPQEKEQHRLGRQNETDRKPLSEGSVGKEVSLEDLLVGTSNRETSDPRDHVYALLGLVSDHRDDRLEPDYIKPTALAYQNATISVIKSGRSLEWLVHAVEGDASVKPSWCIDFSANSWFQKSKWKAGSATVAASIGREEFEIHHDPGSGTIKLAGTEIGRIDET